MRVCPECGGESSSRTDEGLLVCDLCGMTLQQVAVHASAAAHIVCWRAKCIGMCAGAMLLAAVIYRRRRVAPAGQQVTPGAASSFNINIALHVHGGVAIMTMGILKLEVLLIQLNV